MLPSFANLLLLGGLVGIAAPILIHLLLRRRSQRMRFSTVQFFVKTNEQSMQKRKLRNLFLLSLRVLLFTLLVLAFARPYLPNSAAAGQNTKRQQAIVLLDTSASMQASGSQEVHWKKAVAAARQILQALAPDDRAALVLAATHSSTLSGFVPPSVLLKKIDDLQPSFGTADLTEAFRQALKVFATANPKHETTLHVISDLQRSSSQNLATVPLPRELSVRFLDPGERFIPNIAVTDLRLEREGDEPPHAVVTSFSDESYPSLPFRLTIDGKEVFNGTVALESGSVTNLPLAVPALATGWHSAEFSVETKDGLIADNTRYATLRTPEPIRGVVVETRSVDRPFLEESYFVRTALNPAPTGELSSSRFAYDKVSSENLFASLQTKPGQEKTRFVVLCGARQLSSTAADSLKQFVRDGGGILIFLGEGLSANSYNTALGELLPAELGRIEIANEAAWRIGRFTQNSPVFSVFREADESLGIPEFSHRFTLKLKKDATVSAQFEDGTPFLTEQTFGQGRIVLVNTSADTSWTDWQKHKSFVPWLHSAGLFLAKSETAPSESNPSFSAGAEMDLSVAGTQQTLKLFHDGQALNTLESDADGLVRDVLLPAPGIYSLRDKNGVELRRIAASVPNAESDLALLAPGELEQQLVRNPDPAPASFTAGLFNESPQGREFWRLLMIGALLFLVVEPIVANRTAA